MQVKPEVLKAALICAAKGDIRTYLNAVYFDAAGFVVSTDGHRLLIQKCEPFSGEGFIVPREAVELAIKSAGKKQYFIDVNRNAIGNISFPTDDSRYPDFRRVIPDEISGKPGAFNSDYISDFRKVGEILSGSKHAFAAFGAHSFTHNGESSVMMRLTDDCIAILMPIRGADCYSCDVAEAQAFLNPVAEVELQAAE